VWQAPVLVGANGQLHRHRVALDVMLGRLRTREHGFDWPLQEQRGNGGLPLNRQLLFRAERAAARGQGDLDFCRIQIQDLRDLGVVVHRTLALRVDPHASVRLRHGQTGFRLEERDVDRLRVERRVDDVRRGRQRRVHVAAGKRRGRLEHIRWPRCESTLRMHEGRTRLERLEHIRHRLQHLVINTHLRRCLARVERRVGDDHREKVGDAARQFAFSYEHGLIRIVEAGPAVSWNIASREHSNDAGHGRGVLCMNLQHARARVLCENHRAVQHAGQPHVVDERDFSERLLESLIARDRSPDARAARAAVRKRRIASIAKLFTEIRMTSRLRARKRAAVPARLARSLNRVENAAVAGTAAQMAVQRFRDRVAVVRLPAIDQRRRADDDAGDTEAALHAAFEEECLAEHPPRFFGQAFDRNDVAAVHLLGLAKTREGRRSIDHHETAAARPFRRAAVFRRHDAAFLAQHLEELHPRLVGGDDRFPV
jgi:hypothetical protein